MKSRYGWTLVELLIVLAIMVLLVGLIVPTCGRAKRLARLGMCRSNMRQMHIGLIHYAGNHQQRLPPFAYSSSVEKDLPMSCHWGGISQVGDPDGFDEHGFGRAGMTFVNLWALIRSSGVQAQALICPGGDEGLATSGSSYFEHTNRFSTYAVRMPVSRDLFGAAPETWREHGMDIYAQAAGGQKSPVRVLNPHGVRAHEVVPQVRLDGRYRLESSAAAGDGDFIPLEDGIVSDIFWRRGHEEPAIQRPGLRAWPVRMDWCHGDAFNVLGADGVVRTAEDDGTVADNTGEGKATPPDDGVRGASHAERVWQFFDEAL